MLSSSSYSSITIASCLHRLCRELVAGDRIQVTIWRGVCIATAAGVQVLKVDADQRLLQESDVEELVVEDHGEETEGKAAPHHDEGEVVEPVAGGSDARHRNDSQQAVLHQHRQVKRNHFRSCVTLYNTHSKTRHRHENTGRSK